ncbi:hypothetical protein E2C01_027107 [Portunus trituberculatus]|uniref:Uncharacterized protein n=1 Tax=Portunus trituberculatus TaxID=210409 RepID=A0A5B7EKN2_PORTR|nr:hypothetical protein [Portunus trituberculatus]
MFPEEERNIATNSIFGQLIRPHNVQQKQMIRQIEKTQQNLIMLKLLIPLTSSESKQSEGHNKLLKF